MAAVLQAVVDDCRGGSVHRRSAGRPGRLAARALRRAIAYVASPDRAWPFSFENLCEALGIHAERLREELGGPARSHPEIRSPGATPSAARGGPRRTGRLVARAV